MPEFSLKPGERVDDLQISGLGIIQDPGRFCFGMDAVLLSGFVHAGRDERVLDLGTGTGIIPLLLSAKTRAFHLTGLELQEDSADMARRSVEGNGLTDRIDICTGDLREASRMFGKGVFHVVTCNPPYMPAGKGLKNPDGAVAIARHEVACTLADVVREAAACLTPNGRFYLVHRPQRTAEIFREMERNHLVPKRMRIVCPYADRDPNMVLIEARKGANDGLTMEKPLIVFEAPGVYSEEMRRDYAY